MSGGDLHAAFEGEWSGFKTGFSTGPISAAGVQTATSLSENQNPFTGRSFGASNEATNTSPKIDPSHVAGKTPPVIDELARKLGLIQKGADPMNGRGAYIDPVTGEQRILIHPDADPPHVHVNDPLGNRLDINGNTVHPESPDAHLQIGE